MEPDREHGTDAADRTAGRVDRYQPVTQGGQRRGAGLMGQTWLRTLRESADAELVGLVDLDVAAARRSADEAGHATVPVAQTLPAILELVDAQAVIDVTVPVAHRGVATTALRAGLAVLSEKPLADSVSSELS